MNESYFDEFCFKKPTIIMLLYFSSSSALLGVYPLAFLKILHLMLSVSPISLILHTSVDMAMLCSYLSRLKGDLWPEKLFKGFSAKTNVFFCVSVRHIRRDGSFINILVKYFCQEGSCFGLYSYMLGHCPRLLVLRFVCRGCRSLTWCLACNCSWLLHCSCWNSCWI